jgi:hypothetical protein
MRRKRLQHAADILCRMFCGWRLANSYRELASLGTGALRIDALGGSCDFDETPIRRLAIAGELQHWLHDDLAAHQIPPESLACAILTAKLTFGAIPPGCRVTNECYLGPDGKAIRSADFFRCSIDCESEIATDEATYRSSHRAVTEWPDGWP